MAKNHNNNWEQNFALLHEYYIAYHIFPGADVVYQGVRLGKWCANQKLLAKAGKCSVERLEKLQRCGLLDATRDAKWERQYALLQRFLAEYQRFTKRDEVYEGVQLGVWCAEQKRQRNQMRYSEERLQKLMTIGLL